MSSVRRRAVRFPTLSFRTAAALLLLASLGGCVDLASHFEPELGASGDGGLTCPADFAPAATGTGCDPVLPPTACAPGTMPRVGAASCEPVGWTACPAGFAADPSGWGCLDVEPDVPCSGATREVLGQQTCQPLGDCAAAFPPAGATLFVDPAVTTPDATHHASLQAALAAAPAGAVIAVAAGTYAEALVITRPVTLVGRCAEQVVVQAPAPGAAGLAVDRAVAAEVRGLTLRGHAIGARVTGGGTLTLRESLIDANVDYGVLASGAGSKATVVDSVIRDTSALGPNVGHGVQIESGALVALDGTVVKGNHRYGVLATGTRTQATFLGAIVRDTLATSGDFGGMGVVVDPGASATLTRTAVVNSRHRGVRVTQATLTLTDSVVRGTAPRNGGELGDGLSVFGGKATLVRSAVVGNATAGVFAQGATASLEVRDSVVRDTHVAAAQSCGLGASLGASLTLANSALVENDECGLALYQSSATVTHSLVAGTRQGQNAAARGIDVFSASCLDLRDSAVVGSSTLGLAVIDSGADAGCAATLTRSLVSGTLPRDDGILGRGVSVQNAEVTLQRSALLDNREVGLFVSREGATVTATECTVRGTQAEAAGSFGDGLVAHAGSRVTLRDCDVRANQSIGLAFAGATALVSGGFVGGNAVGVHVQEGSTLAEVAGATALGAPGSVTVTTSTRFEANQSRLGAGVVPLPADVGALGGP